MSTRETPNKHDDQLPLRVSSVFVILVASFLGALFPVFIDRCKGFKVPKWVFSATKYFGSGVITGTAFIHLLAPAHEALSNPCLTGAITEYPWVEGISLMAIFALFFVELMTMRYTQFGHQSHGESHGDTSGSDTDKTETTFEKGDDSSGKIEIGALERKGKGGDHDNQSIPVPTSYAAQMTGVFILEFGVIFHSIFVGLTLALAGKEFKTLYPVLTFHQMFEGLALGSRLASIEWYASKRWTPYGLGIGYAISTPAAIAIGLVVQSSYDAGSAAVLITNGVFDSISAGILIYTGLVELMAHDFIFNDHMRQAPVQQTLYAFAMMCGGAGLMAMLGKWA